MAEKVQFMSQHSNDKHCQQPTPRTLDWARFRLKNIHYSSIIAKYQSHTSYPTLSNDVPVTLRCYPVKMIYQIIPHIIRSVIFPMNVYEMYIYPLLIYIEKNEVWLYLIRNWKSWITMVLSGNAKQGFHSFSLYYLSLAVSLPLPLSACCRLMLGCCTVHENKAAQRLLLIRKDYRKWAQSPIEHFQLDVHPAY